MTDLITSASAFDNQVAGHDGVLLDASGDLVIKPSTPVEIAFYESLLPHAEFLPITPRFYGTLTLRPNGGEGGAGDGAPRDAIVLENLTAGFNKPCVVDVKLGRRLWDDNAPLEKRERLDAVAAKTTSGSLAFRVAGMKVWHHALSTYTLYERTYGQGLTAENVRDAVNEFIPVALGKGRRAEVLRRLCEGVGEIEMVVKGVETRMYSASVLIVYEGAAEALDAAIKAETAERLSGYDGEEDEDEEEEFEVITETTIIDGREVQNMTISASSMPASTVDIAEDDDDGEETQPVCRVRLIDFAHTTWTPGEGPDENVLEGVRNLLSLFKNELDSIE
ncbi:inositol polyphosphate kinase-domain-containing protein [Limtongia smithiae]|uniref:inositol polyphosphate kinase-domain-containing protein n=1 Tax=Limtongia smithiae TaxID=1125753 RepID=UPI0034CDD598